MRELRLIGRLDHNFGWRNGHLTDDTLCDPAGPVPAGLCGAVAGIGNGVPGRYRLLRDSLGLNKLFWSILGNAILVAARPRRLVDAGCSFETIRAIPPGVVADLDLERGTARVTHFQMAGRSVPSARRAADGVAGIAARIRSRLHRCFAALATTYHGTHVFICLSGGLDSAGITVLARDYFPRVTAVSFDVRRASGRVSEDRRAAERLARDLDLPLLCATVTDEDVLGVLDTVLVEGADWRDFNVHAALVNACLARAIAENAEEAPRTPRLVLTGDLMNEFLVDYASETYRGRAYYRLPRLDPAALRRVLVRGLETSHREVGPFESWGLPVGQPYAAVADLLSALPADFLAHPDRKQQISRLIFGARIPAYVYARVKTRAQVGDSDSGAGVLGICVDRGVDSGWLRRRYAELHDVRDLRVLDGFIRGGRYRSGVPLSEEGSA